MDQTFGRILTWLLRETGWSAAGLAQAIKVDPAQVRRWLRDERVPALHTEYVQRISGVLQLAEAQRERLETAQLLSLRNKGRGKQQQHTEDSAMRDWKKSLRSEAERWGTSPVPPPARQAQGGVKAAGAVPMREALLASCLTALERLGQPQPGDTICLTFQGRVSAFEEFPDLRDRFLRALRHALQIGWRLLELYGLGPEADRTLGITKEMVARLGVPGSYEPRYFWPHRTLSPPYDLLLLPGKACVMFATDDPDRVGAGVWLQGEQAQVIHAHVELLQRHTQPLLQRFRHVSAERVAWNEFIAETEERSGDRLLIQNGPSTLTQPPAWYQPDTNWTRAQTVADESELKRLIDQQLRRVKAFEQQVEHFRYWNICPKRAITRLVEEGVAIKRVYYKNFVETPEERVAHLRNMIEMLNRYPHFEIALVDESEEDSILTDFFEEVKGDHTVLIEPCPPDLQDEVQIGLAITEPTVAGAFRAYFLEAWGHLSPRNRDKEYVALWLERQLVQAEANAKAAGAAPRLG